MEEKKEVVPLHKEVILADDNGSVLFTWPADEPHLLGSKCTRCGEVVFPRRPQCPKCYKETMIEITLSRRGKVYSSVVCYQPPNMYQGDVPYGFGHVELPEKVLIPAPFTVPEALPIGTPVELVIDEIGNDNEGNRVISYKFRPVEKGV